MARPAVDDEFSQTIAWMKAQTPEAGRPQPKAGGMRIPEPVPPPSAEEAEYRISKPDSDSSDGASWDDICSEDAKVVRGQTVPSWARGEALQDQLERQSHIDPDTIFGGFEKTVDLSAMFSLRRGKVKPRGDSAWWAADGLTPQEDARYKEQMGYTAPAEGGA